MRGRLSRRSRLARPPILVHPVCTDELNVLLMTSRSLADLGEDYMKLQLHLDKLHMAGWVRDLAPWQVIAHLTFRWEVSLEAARRGYERWMGRALARVSYFYAEERNPSRDGYHIHALWADCLSIYRREAWASWFKRFGRARLEPVRSEQDVSDYCSKYVTKEGAWWNVKLQWHRSQALRGESFSLERDPLPLVDTRLPVPQREFGFAAEVFNLFADRPATEDGVSVPFHADDHRQAAFWHRRPDGVFECSYLPGNAHNLSKTEGS